MHTTSSTDSEESPLLETRDVMRILSWPRWRVNRWLKLTGAGTIVRGRYFVTLEALQLRFPAAAQAAAAAIDAKSKKRAATSALTMEHRVSLMGEKVDSQRKRLEALEREVRKNRSEIRKLKRRLRKREIRDQHAATPCGTVRLAGND